MDASAVALGAGGEDLLLATRSLDSTARAIETGGHELRRTGEILDEHTQKLIAGGQDLTAVANDLAALVPYMSTESHAAGEVLFRRGDRADKLYVIQRGRLFLPEIGKHVAAGSVFGEVGLLAAPGTRSLTAVCQDDCQLSTITKEKALELYYQNPTFGMFLLRLLSGYALDHAVADGRTSPGAGLRPQSFRCFDELSVVGRRGLVTRSAPSAGRRRWGDLRRGETAGQSPHRLPAVPPGRSDRSCGGRPATARAEPTDG